MARQAETPSAANLEGALVRPRGRQSTIFEWTEGLARRAEGHDPTAPALGLFLVTLALLGLGLLVQAGHAAAVAAPGEFGAELASQAWFRLGGLVLLLLAARLAPRGLRPFVPALTLIAGLLLIAVFLPEPLGVERNGSNRWVGFLGRTFQPSELARLVIVLWIADRCVRLGPLVRDARRGILPMLALVLAFFALIAAETDLGGAILFLCCALSTLWVGGARWTHVFGSLGTFAGAVLLVAFAAVPYVQRRVAVFLGHHKNQQVESSLEAIARGDVLGLGLSAGTARNEGVPYLDSDFVFAQVGEELGLVGLYLVLLLFVAFAWFSLRLVLSLEDRYEALVAFGLLFSTALQAMLHVQVVSGLAPPKGINLPLISDGGSSLGVTCLAIGLSLGAARRRRSSA